MKIIDIQRFINRFKLISEAVTLPQIRRGILGKDKEYSIVDDEKEWYEDHKSEILSTIEKALNVDDKTLKNKLQKFDTGDFFTNDKPRKLKVKELLKAVRRNFISQVERSRNTEEKTSGIEAQYEMMKMGNIVEVYAVYTPMANRYLTHTKLHIEGCFSPSWCIASSTANNYWNHYHLYEAEYPSVFIVAQKTENGYNPIKYELKCDPHKSSDFKNGKISLTEWVDEWREPEQNEEENSFEGTSIFDTFNISLEDLQNTIRKLVNSKKSSTFSKKFGVEMLNLYTEKINSKDEDTKMEYLTKACKNGTLINFSRYIDKEDKEYFLDELIRYGTLTETEVQHMGIRNNKKAILNLIKNKRCTHLSLKWANRYFDNNMVRKVYHSLPDEILSLDDFDDFGDFNIREAIFENIKNVEGLTEEFLNYQFKNGNVSNTTLDYVKNDKVIFEKCVENMIKNDNVDNETLKLVKDDKELLKKCVDGMIKNDEVKIWTLGYVGHDKELLKKCVENLIKNGEVNINTLEYLKHDKESLKMCVEFLIKNNRVDGATLSYAKYDEESLKMCIGYMIKNDEVYENILNYAYNDKELFLKCIENMLKNDNVYNNTLGYIKNDKGLLIKCVENMIKNDRVNNETLSYAKNDKELYEKCVENMIKNGNVDEYTLLHVKDDKELYEKCVENMIKNGNDEKVLSNVYFRNNKELLKKCIEFLIKNDRVNNDTLRYVKKDKALLKKCIENMIKNRNVSDETLYRIEHDKELYLKCKNYLENK